MSDPLRGHFETASVKVVVVGPHDRELTGNDGFKKQPMCYPL